MSIQARSGGDFVRQRAEFSLASRQTVSCHIISLRCKPSLAPPWTKHPHQLPANTRIQAGLLPPVRRSLLPSPSFVQCKHVPLSARPMRADATRLAAMLMHVQSHHPRAHPATSGLALTPGWRGRRRRRQGARCPRLRPPRPASRPPSRPCWSPHPGRCWGRAPPLPGRPAGRHGRSSAARRRRTGPVQQAGAGMHVKCD